MPFVDLKVGKNARCLMDMDEAESTYWESFASYSLHTCIPRTLNDMIAARVTAKFSVHCPRKPSTRYEVFSRRVNRGVKVPFDLQPVESSRVMTESN
jgi:hypothetical protein